ncbi:MAG: hypothetical protein Fur0037_22010 [Planctomycetota bacterium]
MEKKDIALLLFLIGGAGYGVHANWDLIVAKLGLDDLRPGRIKAVELAKKARIFEQYRSNWEVLKDWRASERIAVLGDPWSAEKIDDRHYAVYCSFREEGEPHRHRFDVDLPSGAVTYAGEVEPAAPAPR